MQTSAAELSSEPKWNAQGSYWVDPVALKYTPLKVKVFDVSSDEELIGYGGLDAAQ